jgi:hypothetical protein
MPDVLAAWSSFYVIAGSSAGAMTGLMFIVITLVTGVEALRRAPDGIDAFSTPTVVHLCVALLVSIILSVPWHSLAYAGAMLGLTGVFGLCYVAVVARRQRRMTVYRPELEDYIWYVGLPGLAYAAVIGGAISLRSAPGNALYALAAGVTLLIFIGIHNAWDIVTFIAVGNLEQGSRSGRNERAGSPTGATPGASGNAPTAAPPPRDHPRRPRGSLRRSQM